MKKLLSVTVAVLFSLDLFLPLCTIVCGAFGYSFSLFSYSFFCVAVCLISIFAAVLSFLGGDEPLGKVFSVFASLLPVLTVLNCIFSFFKCPKKEFFVVGAAMLLALTGAVVCSLKTGKPVVLNALSIATSLLAVIPVVIIGLFVFVMADFGQRTVVDTIPSPDGERWIEVVDSDDGALGGNTVVRVCEDKGIDCFVFKTEKMPVGIYVGEWREYLELDIRWKDDNCIVIGSREYRMD